MIGRSVVLLVPLAIAAGPLAAQEEEPRYEFGANAAVTFSKFAGSDAQDPRVQYGFGVGAFLTLRLTRAIAVEPELQYVQKGTRFRTEDTKSSLQIGYLQLPLLVQLRLPNGPIRPHVYGGIAAGYRIDCRLKVTTGTSSLDQSCRNLAEPPPRHGEVSAIVGAGVDAGVLLVGLRFDLGLTRIGSTPGQEDIKNRSLSLVVGSAFRGPR